MQRRGTLTGAVGLGDFIDVTYSVLVTVGGVQTPLVLDTGSSDLWIASDACTDCAKTVPLFPQASFTQAGMDVKLLYGDSLTGTHAAGVIGTGTVSFAGLTIPNQFFAAINNTSTNVIATGSAGIFGLGFALNSVIWNKVFSKQFAATAPASRRALSAANDGTRFFPDLTALVAAPKTKSGRRLAVDYGTRFFPDLTSLVAAPKTKSSPKRASSDSEAAALTAAVLQSYATQGPALTRMVTTNSLAAPMFAVTLQRNTLDIGGNAGVLSIGALPGTLRETDLLWAPVRKYPNALRAPADSPNESYPIAWEIFLDDVYLDGVRLPRSNLSSPDIKLSALIDTGNSLVRGPADVVAAINKQLGGATYACAEPHTLAFSIGGKLFPVDPRDFAEQRFNGQLRDCVPAVVATDAPEEGRGYQYSWSIGVPFLKGVLAAFHYGNVTHPSVDAPRIGFVSTVPDNAGALLQSAIAKANAQNGGDEFSTTNPAPTGVPVAGGAGTGGVPLAGKLGGNTGTGADPNGAAPRGTGRAGVLAAVVTVAALVGGFM